MRPLIGSRIIGSTILLLFATSIVQAGQATVVAKKYEVLLAEYEQEGDARSFAKRFLSLAKEDIKDPVAADALLWVVGNVRGRAETVQAIQLLTKHHATSEKMESGCRSVANARTVNAESLLRLTLETNKHHQVKVQACFYLALLLDREAAINEQIAANPKLAPRILQYYGKQYGDHLAAISTAELAKQRDIVYSRLLSSFGDSEIDGEEIGPIAKRALRAMRHLSVGKIAPEIKGIDMDGEPFKLSDYRGKVVMLSFWGHW